MGTNATDSEPDWEQIRAFLDESIAGLSHADRDALLLRYFEKKPLAEVGAALGLSADAARMRVDRAVNKLRSQLALSGITSTAAVLARLMAANVVGPAPATLGARIASQALAGAGSSSAGLPGALASLSTTRGLAWLTAGVLSLLMAVLLLRPRSPEPQPRPNSVPPAVRPAPDVTSGGTGSADASEAKPATPQGMVLVLEDADTGLALPSQIIGLRGWDPSANVMVEKTVQLDDHSRCVAPFVPGVGPDFRITTHVEGYADSSLRWETQRGEAVPDSYSLRLVRPVVVHGRVVDYRGRSVGDAEVSFGHVEVPRGREGPEGHDFDVLTAKTDAEGRWEIRRLAPEMVRYLCGSATHPEHSMSEMFFASRDAEAVSRLLDGTFVFRLSEGAVFHGEVVNADGQPLAEASVRVGMRGESHSRETRSASDGSFKLTGCVPGKALVTVVAEGFAPLALMTDLSADTPPMRLTLGPGRALRLRVVDGTGQPLAGASVELSLQASENPQVAFSSRTDAEGRLVWEQAPDQELLFDVWVPKYVGRQEAIVRPDDLEHVITNTLPRGPRRLVVTGTVSDADTGEPLPRFHLGVGHIAGSLNGAEEPLWGALEGDWPRFTGGTFRYMSGPEFDPTPNRVYLFRFEAENYAAQVMRVQRPEEGEVRLDVQLHRAEDVLILVYTPEGVMAAGADIGLLARGSGLELAPGGLAAPMGGGASITSGWLRRADAQGQFLLPQDDTVRRIAVAHPKGYAEIEVEELRKARAVRLAPWGVIEGCWRVGGQPVVNGQIHLQSLARPPAGQRLSRRLEVASHSFRTRTDAKGSFRFSMAPLGLVELHVWPPDLNQSVRAAVLEVRPGETNRVFVGDPEAPPGE
jgi:hypothetical protein